MKVQILDRNALMELLPTNVSAYLKSRKAEFVGYYRDRASIWSYSGKQLLLPLSTSLDDYAPALARLLKLLEEIESRDQLAIYRDIANSAFDVIRVRNSSDATANGTLSIERSVDFVNYTKEMMSAIACSVATNKRYYPRKKPNAAEDFMRQLRFGQTEHGSFVLTLLSPVAPDLTLEQGTLVDIPEDEPYERKVVPSLQTALEALNEAGQKASQNDTLNPFLEGADKYLSANLCDAVVGLHETAENGFVEVRVSFALNRKRHYESRPVVFRKDYIPYFKEASKQIKAIEPLPDQIIRGPIIAVRREEGASGVITIQDISSGKSGRRVQVTLPDDEYAKAVDAHRDRGLIELTGTVKKEGSIYRVPDPDNIKIIEIQWEKSEEQ